MNKFPSSNNEQLHDRSSEVIRRMGHTSLQQNNAEANKMDIYRNNIDPYIEKGSHPGYGGFGWCLETKCRAGCAFNPSNSVANYLLEVVDLDGKVKTVTRFEDQDPDFYAEYIPSDNTIYLNYRKDREDLLRPSRTKEDEKELTKSRVEFQLHGKYDNFYRTAMAIWHAHQAKEREKYKSFTTDMLVDEIILFAIRATMCGMQQEEEHLRKRVAYDGLTIDGVPRPRGNLTAAKRLASIEGILDKFEATLDNFGKVSAKINKRNEALN